MVVLTAEQLVEVKEKMKVEMTVAMTDPKKVDMLVAKKADHLADMMVDKKVEWTVVLSVDMRVLRKVEKRAAMKDGQMVECWELKLVVMSAGYLVASLAELMVDETVDSWVDLKVGMSVHRKVEW